MFDKIPMIQFKWNQPRTPKNKKNFPDFSYSFSKDAKAALDSDFVLDGIQHFIQPRPISDYTREHFFYLQSFVWLESESAYYTRRSNYNSYLLLYTYEGSGILEYCGKVYHLTAESGFIIDCNKPHYYHTDSSFWSHCDIHFNGISTDYFFSLWQQNKDVSFKVSQKDFQVELEKLLYDYINFSIERDFLVSNRLESLLLFLLQEKKRITSGVNVPDTIRYLIKYMESNYTSHLSLDELSRFSGLSKYHLSREFKRYTGKSPNEYLIDLRIANAKFLLISTDISCYKIGELSGIPDFNNFVRLFKKNTGLTPSQFRR